MIGCMVGRLEQRWPHVEVADERLLVAELGVAFVAVDLEKVLATQVAVEWEEQVSSMGLGVWPAGELERLKRMKRGHPNIITTRLHHCGPNVKCGQRTHGTNIQ